jgi:GTP-binding protein
MNFIDFASIYVKAGNGGNGCTAFLREKFRPKGGPSGGDGGRGGHIIIASDSNLSTLQDVSYNKKYIAKNGGDGKGKNMHGKNGENIYIRVPLGTIVRDTKADIFIDDLKDNNKEIIIVHGGNGGFGNARFKTQNNPAPRRANQGQIGEEKTLELELKILADVGLVGFPNAGKSTFISRVSNARPKIADYPFTTLVPNLGIVKYGEFQSFVLADIPGLIQGASKGKGLGSQFLRHVERTKVLAYMLDATSEDILEDLHTLKKELKQHNPKLLLRPSILLITKIDLLLENSFSNKKIDDIPQLAISSVTGYNINKSIQIISEIIQSVSDLS